MTVAPNEVAAQERLDAEEYGVCVDCQGDIDMDCLRALPEALLCKRCARKLEGQIKATWVPAYSVESHTASQTEQLPSVDENLRL
jgi:hypothetical protein